MLMKAKIEAARAICFATAVAADLARSAESDAARRSARLREELQGNSFPEYPLSGAWDHPFLPSKHTRHFLRLTPNHELEAIRQ